MVIRRDVEGISKKSIIGSRQLVPGDLIEITNNMILPSDVILIYGTCVVEDPSQPRKTHTNTKTAVERFSKSID